MINKKPVRFVVFLLALSLSAPISVWAGYYGHHGYGHHGYYSQHGYYGHHYYPGFYGYSSHSQHGVASIHLGALDLNVKPKKTQVYLNGNYIGMTDRFDGFPGYLWLREGTDELIFYNEGYMTMVQNSAIYPGVVIDVRVRLVQGKPVPPEKLLSKTTLGDESR